ncbi:MAG TPA: ABC transporter permease [Anaerolineales bacterium]|nr:ABC transporter permease [Anaerolineales bacterium]
MELRVVWTLAQRELREALRNRWLWFFAGGFAVLALALSRASLASAGYSGLGGFGRTTASLVNALLLFVPLLGLTVGAGIIAGDRERGTLTYLMAQPLTRAEIFAGKALGASIALAASLALGFGLAALGLASAGGGNPEAFLSLAGFTFLLAVALLGLGLAISAISRRAGTASGAALVAWLGLVFLSDLGLVGTTIAFRPAPSSLLAMLLVNPLQTFKVAAIYSLRSTLDALGPVGQYAMHRFGESLPLLFVGVLTIWILLAFGLAYVLFRRLES